MKQEYRSSGADAGTNGVDQLTRPHQVAFAELANADVEAAGRADGPVPGAGRGLTAGRGQHVVYSQFRLASPGKQAPGEVVRRNDENPITGAMGGSAADRIDVGKVRLEHRRQPGDTVTEQAGRVPCAGRR